MIIHIKTKTIDKNISIPVTNDKVPLSSILPGLYRLFDIIIEAESSQALTDDQTITCQKSCGACCCQLVPLAIPEIFSLQNVVESLPKKRQKVVKTKINDALNKLGREQLLEPLKRISRKSNLDERFFTLSIPCPFLEDQSCSIYEDRPFMCREYLVTSNKELCKDPYSKEVAVVKIKRNIGALLAVFSSRLYQASLMPVPLVLFLNTAKQLAPLQTMTWKSSWLMHQMLDALMQLNDDDFTISIIEENKDEK